MGVVYKATMLKLADGGLKFLPPQLTGDSNARHRFLGRLSRIRDRSFEHLHIHEVDETPDGPSLSRHGAVSDGQTLDRESMAACSHRQRPRRSRWPSRALAKAHRAGIIPSATSSLPTS